MKHPALPTGCRQLEHAASVPERPGSPLVPRHSPLTTRHSPLALALLLVLCSPLFHSSLATRHSPLALYALDVPSEVLQAEQQRIEAIERASAATVAIFANNGRGGGSGVVITPDGYALTNYHVSQPAGDYMKCGMNDGNLYEAVIVGIDPTGDVALIKLLGRDDFPYAEMADSDQVRVGDWCFAVGNPFMLATNFEPTVTYGIVSGVNRYQEPAGTLLEYADCIQTDASINPGNSGGPLFNAAGQLIGINGRGSFEKRGRVNVGVGYAISINQIKNFLGYLHSGRIVDHATLGATVSTGERGRVIVSNILESSDAYRRGLRYGDQIVQFGGRPIRSANEFKNVLGIFPRDWRVPLSFRRDGRQHDIYVRLMGVHSHEELLAKTQQPIVPEEERLPQPNGDEQPEGDAQPEGDQQPGAERERPRGDQPPRQQRPGRPRMPGMQQRQAEIPEHAAAKIQQRRGFSNYYFNELNLQRVWSAFEQHGQFDNLSPHWTLRGQLDSGGDVRIELRPERVAAAFPGAPAELDTSQDLDEQLVPEGSGGLLAALYVWQQLLINGPDALGDVYYLGTMPLMDHDGLYDTLAGIYNVVDARFLFDPETGHLTAMELFTMPHSDPCEVYFSEYAEVDGRQMPRRMLVRHGNDVFAEMHITNFDLGDATAAEASDLEEQD